MKLLGTLAFAAAALFAATFATAAPAKANDFSVYAGSNGFGVQVSNYGHGGYYGGYYGGGYDPCLNRKYYKRNRHCWGYSGGGYYYGGYPSHGYRYGYYPRPRHNNWGHRGGHRHWGHGGRHRNWGHGGRHRGWGHGGGHRGRGGRH
jgi:hypothetical protein